MKTFTHKGADIAVLDNGKFSASVAGQPIEAPSLDAIRAKIDQLMADTFAPFDAFLLDDSWSWRDDCPELVEVRVVGLSHEGRMRYRKVVWRTESHGRREGVYLATPENLAKAQAYVKLRKANIKKRAAMELAEEKLSGELESADFDRHGKAP